MSRKCKHKTMFEENGQDICTSCGTTATKICIAHLKSQLEVAKSALELAKKRVHPLSVDACCDDLDAHANLIESEIDSALAKLAGTVGEK